MADLIFIDKVRGVFCPVDRKILINGGDYLRLPNGKLYLVKSIYIPFTNIVPVAEDFVFPQKAVIVDLEIYPIRYYQYLE